MGITLEELVVKLTTDNAQFKTEMAASQKATEKSMGGIQKAIESMNANSQKPLSMFQQSFATLAGVVGGNLLTGAFNMLKDAAKELFQVFVVDGVKAAIEEENAINRLNNALQLSGQYSEGASRDMLKFAAEMQKTTVFSDDAIINNAALIQSLGRLSTDGLQRATRAAADLAALLHIDLTQASQMVGKAAEGNVLAFKKAGFQLEEGADKAKTFEKALQAIESRAGGSAAAQTKTFGGAIEQLKNNFGDLVESIGYAIIHNETLMKVLKFVNETIVKVTSSMGGYASEQDRMREKLRGLIGEQAKLQEVLDRQNKDFQKNFMKDMVQDVEKLQVQIDETAGALRKMNEENAKGKVHARELTEVQKAQIEAADGVAKSYISMASDSKLAHDRMIEDVTRLRDQKMQAAKEEADSHFIGITQLRDRKEQEKGIQEEFYAQQIEALAAQKIAEQQQIDIAEAEGKRTKEEALVARQQLDIRFDREGRKLTDERTKFRKVTEEQEIQDRKNQIAVLAGLQNSQNAYAKAIGKAAAVAHTIIHTQEGAQAAYAALAGIPYVGPFLGAAAAAAVIADGAVRLANIRGAKTGITEVPGVGSSDNFGPVALAPGERVVDSDTNKDLKLLIATMLAGGGNRGGGAVAIELSMKDNVIDFIEARLIERQRLNFAQGAF